MSGRQLSSAPDLRILYPKALIRAALGVVHRVPGTGLLPVVPKPGEVLPARELLLTEVTVEHDRLSRYAEVCGLKARGTLPATYPHVVAFPLALELMTDLSFPFPLLGMVHIANRITQRRAVGVDEPLALRVRAERLRPHRRGRQFDVVTEASVDDDTVWQEHSTYLHREGDGDTSSSDEREPRTEPDAVWHVAEDIGRRYASVSGDVNPIHLHSLPARLFGFPNAIAHGMWLKARCLGALQERLPSAQTVEAQFKKPIVLPTEVSFHATGDGDEITFAARDPQSGTPHLVGSAAPATDGPRT